MSSKRSSKRELIAIDEDESSNEQPAVKSKKGDAEPLPSLEVLELQKKVIDLQLTLVKLEKNYEGACRIAGEAQARIQFLEGLVDSKPKVIDGAKNTEREDEMEMKVNDLTKQLDDLRKKYHSKKKRKHKLMKTVKNLTNQLAEKKGREGKHENTVKILTMLLEEKDAREGELEKKVTTLTNQLEEKKGRENKLEKELTTLSNQLEENKGREDKLEKDVSYLRKQLDEERVDRVRNQSRMDFLTGQLGEFERWADQVQLIPFFSVPPDPRWPLQAAVGPPPKLHDNAHPTNILQLCRPDTPDTISVVRARIHLNNKINEKGGKNVAFKPPHAARCNAGYFDSRRRLVDYENLDCELCEKTITKYDVIAHFLAKPHNCQVPHDAAVSLAAFQHWLRLVQPTPAPRAPVVRTAAPAAAAVPDVGGATKEIKKEEVE